MESRVDKRIFGVDECTCEDHNSGAIMCTHIFPCCERCEYCGLRIMGNFEDHLKRCPKNPNREIKAPETGC